MKTKGVERALEKAFRFETEGHQFFLQAAEKAQAYLTRSLFPASEARGPQERNEFG